MSQGLEDLDFSDDTDLNRLRQLYANLQQERRVVLGWMGFGLNACRVQLGAPSGGTFQVPHKIPTMRTQNSSATACDDWKPLPRSVDLLG